MDQALIDDDALPLVRKSVLPHERFFYPESLIEAREEAETEAAVADTDVVVIADADADGLACVALVREARGEGGLVPTSPHDLEETLERVASYGDPGLEVFVCDLCPDAYDPIAEAISALVDTASAVHWFDHHQWDGGLERAVRSAGVHLVVGASDEECTADVALRSIDYDFPDHLRELATVTRDHDLWLREDPRSDDIADYAYWEDAETYVETVREHGPSLPEHVLEYLADRRVEKEALIELAVQRAVTKSIGPWTVGVTYGRCSQNEVAEALREQGADAAVVVKPTGSASLRGSETFERCHEVAGRVNGGGHPRAAGCKPSIYDDMLDYAHHWTTEGAATKRVILEAFRAVAREAESDPDRLDG